MAALRSREWRLAWLWMSPALALLAIGFGWPMLRALGRSFWHENLATGLQPEWAGLANYRQLLADSRFWQDLGITSRFTLVSVSLELALGLAIALLLHQRFSGRGLVRTLSLLPWALPTAVMAIVWGWLFNDQFGLVNDLLLRLGLIRAPLAWLAEPALTFWTLIVADVWKTTPFAAILLLAGLQAIPRDLYEAHAVDGASPWQSFQRITLPLLWPQILILLLFRGAEAFGIFDLVKVMTGGGPGGSTETLSVYLYSTVMRYLDFGYGAALVMVSFAIIAVAAGLGALLLIRREAR